MIKHATHRLTLALALAVLAIPAGRVFAQSSVAPTPAGVTGTDPEPQGSEAETILALLGLA
jgi:hypothetical protein